MTFVRDVVMGYAAGVVVTALVAAVLWRGDLAACAIGGAGALVGVVLGLRGFEANGCEATKRGGVCRTTRGACGFGRDRTANGCETAARCGVALGMQGRA